MLSPVCRVLAVRQAQVATRAQALLLYGRGVTESYAVAAIDEGRINQESLRGGREESRGGLRPKRWYLA